MSAGSPWWVPDGLGARFALVLASTLLAANLVAFFLLSLDDERVVGAMREDRRIDRIVELVPVLEAMEPHLRRAVARATSTWVARVEVDGEPRVRRTLPDQRSRSLATPLSSALAPREVRAAIVDRRDMPDVDDGGPRGNGPALGEAITVSIALNGRSDPSAPDAPTVWMNVAARGNDRAIYAHVQSEAVGTILVLSLIAVLGIGLLFVRHLVRPISRLAQAARAAGEGDRKARVPEHGARELREAAIAFNTMQEQIARFDAERIRTVAAVGHDLRTPITSLRIRAEMLDEAARAPMIRTLEEMTVMAEGLVAFSHGRTDAEPVASISLRELLLRLGEERGARVNAPRELLVPGRPVALTRAIGNLVDNAVRYGGRAWVTLVTEGRHALVLVEDDGPGIPDDRLTEIFEPFVRGEHSRSTETGGVGLGLSIARTILRSHKGSVTLSNRAGGGLRASVRLPLPDKPPRAPSLSARALSTPGTAASPERRRSGVAELPSGTVS